eukprot:9763601-Alexandrium_andersonii.AAC.1
MAFSAARDPADPALEARHERVAPRAFGTEAWELRLSPIPSRVESRLARWAFWGGRLLGLGLGPTSLRLLWPEGPATA